ncbi:MAG: sodium:alanine symporter family protein [Lachnospiraceae bacterium]|nr:sodium:alanine symporter family protein [Lachnospiraceae bacterium]
MPELITKINSILNNIVWGPPVLTLLIGTGILLTVLTGGFQFTHFGHAMRYILGTLKHKKKSSPDTQSISQFQALCTALSGTIGTGNISGIAYAIAMGGPGAIFWMWIAAFIGMITGFAEKVLGIYYRRRNKDGEWCGGAMYYLRDGLGNKKGCKTAGKILAALFSLFTVFASFGMGNLSQVASIRESVLSLTSFTGNSRMDAFLIGVCIAVLTAFVTLGGLKRIAKANETLVPFMAVFYILGTAVIIAMNAGQIVPAILSIFRHAFSLEAAAGGAGGIMLKQAITCGFKRGVFSNEAGLGSSVIVHATADVKEPVVQGFWGIFEVFFDTIVLCTLTALLILTSGVVDLNTGTAFITGSSFALATEAFTASFGIPGGIFMTVAIALFAVATVFGWNYYGSKAWEYLFGTRTVALYKYIYIAVILLGCTLKVDLIIDLSDTFNGLMAIPNLVGVLSLSGTVLAVLNNYKQRNIKGHTGLKPMLSYFSDKTYFD